MTTVYHHSWIDARGDRQALHLLLNRISRDAQRTSCPCEIDHCRDHRAMRRMYPLRPKQGAAM